MKSFVRFSKWEDHYSIKDYRGDEYGILGIFFIDDVSCSTIMYNFFTEWLDKPNINRVGGNIITVDLEENDIIEIRNVLDEEAGPAFRIPKDQYLKMMGLWKDLCKVKPKEITVTWDGKEITVEGKN